MHSNTKLLYDYSDKLSCTEKLRRFEDTNCSWYKNSQKLICETYFAVGTSKLNKRPIMIHKMEIIENGLCLTVPKQVDVLAAELVPLKRMCNEDFIVEQVSNLSGISLELFIM